MKMGVWLQNTRCGVFLPARKVTRPSLCSLGEWAGDRLCMRARTAACSKVRSGPGEFE